MTMQSDKAPDETEYSDELRPGTVLLHGQYVIESYLVRGGFGVTYLARDSLDRTVVIKECFPSTICCRVDGRVYARSRQNEAQFASVLRHFIREARRLSKLSHPDIVGVHQVFEERETAYMALDFVNGNDLLTILEDERDRLVPELVVRILKQTLEAIGYIHDQGILHRDISPDNILLDSADSPTLIDFGAARDHATKENRALSALLTVKDGYSPQEFYLSDELQRPSSDLYSLGATFYHVITGEAPPQSQQRLAAVASRGGDPYQPLVSRVSGYDKVFLAAIDRSLEIFPDDRFQSAADWLVAIDGTLDRQVEESRVQQDDHMLRTISKLVENTNANDVNAPAPVTKERRRPAMRTEFAPELSGVKPMTDEASGDRKFVDMFGNPIEDVEAWMAAQERDRARESQPQPEKADPKPEATPQRSGFLRSLLGRVTQQTTHGCGN